MPTAFMFQAMVSNRCCHNWRSVGSERNVCCSSCECCQCRGCCGFFGRLCSQENLIQEEVPFWEQVRKGDGEGKDYIRSHWSMRMLSGVICFFIRRSRKKTLKMKQVQRYLVSWSARNSRKPYLEGKMKDMGFLYFTAYFQGQIN